ncbi:MAG: type IV secretory system conjugative DNA transfer family protein [Firmicutes bacterium]|nr:type IV secretory system conjugative DNA transfer family protein [Bacillota bacterium]
MRANFSNVAGKISVKSFKKWMLEHKKTALILGVLPVAVPFFYFADVLVLGSVAAAIHDIQHQIKATSFFASPEQKAAAAAHSKMLPYISQHPISVGKAWLTSPIESLTHPDVKRLWFCLNVFIGVCFLIAYSFWRLKRVKNNSSHVHGLKLADNAVYGTTRWASKQDVEHLCDFGPPQINKSKQSTGGIVLGKLSNQKFFNPIIRVIPGKAPKGKPSLAGHVAIFGGTGSGKTFSYVFGNIIAAVADGQSFICTDPKGELAATTAKWLKEKGYEVKIFNLSNPATSNRWNAITECKNDAEIAEMAACLIKNAGKDDNAYFLAKEIQLLEALTGLLKGDFPVEQQHLRAAMSLTAWTKEELDARFKAAYQTEKISATIYERWRGVSSANYDHAVSGLSAKLKILTTEPLAALLSEHEINLSEMGSKKMALFCVIPVSGENKVLQPILSTFYMFLFKRLYSLADQYNGKLLVPVRFLLDEFANIGRIPGFSEIISTARSLGMHIQFILQGRSQLDDVYGVNEAKNILANCPTILLLGVTPSDQETAVMFSKILGKTAVEGKFEKEDLTIPVVHHFKLAEKTQSAIKRSLMEPDEIARMDPLDCIALIQWCYPLYLKKLGWVKLPQAKEIKQAGQLLISELVQTRSFKVKLPEIAVIEERNANLKSALWLQKISSNKEDINNHKDFSNEPGSLENSKENESDLNCLEVKNMGDDKALDDIDNKNEGHKNIQGIKQSEMPW